jgi:peptidoglycan/LPS O-acetylase OafA/YrhL
MTVRDAVGRVAGAVWLRYAAAICLLMIAVLSLVPRDLGGVDDSAVHGPVQHFVAYLAAGLLAGLATRERRSAFAVILALAAFSCLMEVLQYWSPGRSPEVQGFVASSVGAAAGALVAYAIRPAYFNRHDSPNSNRARHRG